MNKKLILVVALVSAVMIGAISYSTIASLWIDRHNHAAQADRTPASATLAGKRDDDVARRALPALRVAAVRAPADAGAWTRLGDAELRLRQGQPAIDAYRRALAIDGKQASLWSSLGEAYVDTTPSDGPHMPPSAKAAFDKAVAIDPNDMRARFYLAGEKDALGMHDAAMADWIGILGAVPRGSQPDRAVRAAIGGAMRRNLQGLEDRLNAAIRTQPAS